VRVVLAHIDLRLYWKARLKVLLGLLKSKGASLTVIQTATSGTLYDFTNELDSKVEGIEWIHLFRKEDKICDIPPRTIAKALWDRFESIEPDVIVADPISFYSGATAVRWCRYRRKGVVIMDDSRAVDVPRSWLVNHIKRRFYRNVDAMFVPAPSHVQSYVNWGIPKNRIFIGLDVVDNNFFAERALAAKTHLDNLRIRYELPHRFFLGVGRQVPKKNWGTLISGYKQYRDATTIRPWGLVLVGDGPERKSLENMVLENAIQGVHFRPFCDQEKLCEYYAMAECLVLASYYGETWGLVVNEAMACGLPVLISENCGCAQTLVRQDQNGWTFSPDHPEELTEAMLRLSSLSEPERQAMGQKSREIVSKWSLERFSWQLMRAIELSKGESRGFYSFLDSLIIRFWKGRYNPS